MTRSHSGPDDGKYTGEGVEGRKLAEKNDLFREKCGRVGR